MVNILSAEQVSKSYGDKVLFDRVSFGLAEGDKVALVARNGAGKTTLLKILAGTETADSGIITNRKEIRIAFLDQEPYFNEEETVIENVFSHQSVLRDAIEEYEEAIEQNEKDQNDASAKRLHLATSAMDANNAWDFEVRARQVLSRLNIFLPAQKIKTLSGGQRKRLALARVLILQPELLILDEPTNHLDVEMIEWLEDYLSQQQLTILMVTHDRYFLNNVCNQVWEMDDGKLYQYKGESGQVADDPYEYFLRKKEEREFIGDRAADKTRNILKRELEWVRRMPKARTTKSKSRVDAFYELKEKGAVKKKEDDLTLNIRMNRIGGKVVEMKKVYKSYGEKNLIRGFDYTFKTGERIGIVGSNGTGKTTFLNLVTGIEPADSGKINVGETVVFGYYNQKGLQLKEDKRVIEVVKDIADVIRLADGSKVQASAFLNLFQFPPSMQQTFVSKLSGGEKRRLFLLTVLVRNPNFLILDEPTNDLDLITLNILEDFLMAFQGCLLVVSHDRYFMEKLVEHLFVFDGTGMVKDFNGSYMEYRMVKAAEEKAALQSERIKAGEQKQLNKAAAEKKKVGFKEKFEFETLGKEIEQLEAEKSALTAKLEMTNDHEELQRCAKRLQDIMDMLDEKSMRWLELSELVQ
jgi:ATP-binding cassette subfamily F protein uup